MFTKDCPIDVVKPVSSDKSGSACGTSETLHVVHIALSSHYHLTGRNGLSTCTACSTVAEQTNVVIPTKNHATLGIAGCADLSQLSLATWALETTYMPISLHGIQQETVSDFPSAARTGFGWRTITTHCSTARLGISVIHHGLLLHKSPSLQNGYWQRYRWHTIPLSISQKLGIRNASDQS